MSLLADLSTRPIVMISLNAGGGNVGIGTSSPDAKLTIEGAVDPGIYLRSTVSDTGNGEPKIRFYEQSNLRWDIYMDGGNNNQLNFSTDGTFANTAFSILSLKAVGVGDAHADAHLEVSANGTTGGNVFLVSSDDGNDGDLLTLTETGRLGLSTTAPGAKLHVVGDVFAPSPPSQPITRMGLL